MAEPSEPSKFFYRYRTIDAILGKRRELELQQIYFASSDQLNDPMEGSLEVFWEGDAVLWRNLFRHYLLSLSNAVAVSHLAGKDFDRKGLSGMLDWTAYNLPTDVLKQRHQRVCQSFFELQPIEELLSRIAASGRRVYRDELAFYLSVVHGSALNVILKTLHEDERLNFPTSTAFPQHAVGIAVANVFALFDQIEGKGENEEAIRSALFETSLRLGRQINLSRRVQQKARLHEGWTFVCLDFPDFYARNVSSILYPKWYAACFVADPTHAAMWGH